ncbi:MAG: methyl-accepting chemotaxis protein [Pseudomonadota bacterium]
MGIFADWSLQKKILSGFGLILCVLAALAILSFSATSILSSIFTDYRLTARKTLVVNEFVDDLFKARIGAFKYRISPSDDAANEVNSNIDAIMKLQATVNELFAGWETTTAQFDALSAKTLQYRDAFERMGELQAEREIQVAQLTELGPKARKQLTSIMETAYRDGDAAASYHAGIAQQELMLGRFYTERFLLTNTMDSFEMAKSHFDKAKEALDVLLPELQNPDRRQNAEATIADLAAYRATSDAILKIISERNAIRDKELDVLGPQMQLEYESILKTIVERQNTLGKKGSDKVDRTLLRVLTFAVVALMIGSLLAYLMGRSVTRSVIAMANDMNALAKGDLSVAIKGTDKTHELGQMAKALAVFKDALILRQQTARKEEAEAEAMKERQKMMDEMLSDFGATVDGAVGGDFTGRVPVELPDEELNQLAKGVNRLLETVQFGVGETGRVMEAVASGDLKERMSGDLQGDFADLKRNVNETVERLSDLVGQIASTTEDVRSGSEQISSSAQDLAQRAEQQASSLEQTAATMEEMSASIKSNADNSASASSLAADASSRADQGGQIVKNAVSAMFEIQTSASQIADIISVIDSIAFQTNLLALNAAVEAARAGDAGKGFAVVASEVRALAQRSSEASRDIRQLIETSASQVSQGVKLVTKTGSSLEGIVTSINEVEAAVKAITDASTEQAGGVQEILTAINHMDQITQQNATMSDRSAASSRALTGGAQRLHELVAFFKIEGMRVREAAEAAEDAEWMAFEAEQSAPQPTFAPKAAGDFQEF